MNTIINFGKYEGKNIEYLLNNHLSYCKWLCTELNCNNKNMLNFIDILKPLYDDTIRINKINKQAVILFGSNGSWGENKLYLDSKLLCYKDNKIDLSYGNEILYNELKHLEILAHTSWFIN